jgi:hypothetical protein
MVNWLCLNVVALMNMVGILLDIAGAYFVAYEVIRKFHGEKYEEGIGSGPIGGVPANDPPIETEAFRLFERRRFQRMKVGLVLLTIGFALQFLANALQLKSATLSIERTPSGLRSLLMSNATPSLPSRLS